MADFILFFFRFYFYMNSIFLFMNNLVGTQTLEADTRWKKKTDTNSFHDTIVLLGFIKQKSDIVLKGEAAYMIKPK